MSEEMDIDDAVVAERVDRFGEPEELDVDRLFLDTFRLPLRQLFLASPNHRSREIFENHRDGFVNHFQLKSPRSTVITMTGCVETGGRTDGRVRKKLSNGSLSVEILDGNHRLSALEILIEDDESKWSAESIVMVHVYKDPSDQEAIFLSRSRNQVDDCRREETVFDQARLFRKLNYLSQGIPMESADLNPRGTAADNKNIAQVLEIPLKQIQGKYKSLYQCSHFPVKTWRVLNAFMVQAEQGHIAGLPQKRNVGVTGDVTKSAASLMIFKHLKLQLKTDKERRKMLRSMVKNNSYSALSDLARHSEPKKRIKNQNKATDPNEMSEKAQLDSSASEVQEKSHEESQAGDDMAELVDDQNTQLVRKLADVTAGYEELTARVVQLEVASSIIDQVKQELELEREKNARLNQVAVASASGSGSVHQEANVADSSEEVLQERGKVEQLSLQLAQLSEEYRQAKEQLEMLSSEPVDSGSARELHLLRLERQKARENALKSPCASCLIDKGLNLYAGGRSFEGQFKTFLYGQYEAGKTTYLRSQDEPKIMNQTALFFLPNSAATFDAKLNTISIVETYFSDL